MSIFALVALLLVGTAGTALAEEFQYTTALSGSNEVGEGDPDGSGSASVSINSISNEVCFTITTSGIADANAAHIHEAGAGQNGGVVVNFDWDATLGDGCVGSDAQTVGKILANPSLYYVNVHNADFAAGALRGQLAGESAAPAAAAPAADAPAADAPAADAPAADAPADTTLAVTGSTLTGTLVVIGALSILTGAAMVRSAGRRSEDD